MSRFLPCCGSASEIRLRCRTPMRTCAPRSSRRGGYYPPAAAQSAYSPQPNANPQHLTAREDNIFPYIHERTAVDNVGADIILLRCPASSSATVRRPHLPTAATRSARFICRWQRSHRSPPARHILPSRRNLMRIRKTLRLPPHPKAPLCKGGCRAKRG